jgi:hypothetical protein
MPLHQAMWQIAKSFPQELSFASTVGMLAHFLSAGISAWRSSIGTATLAQHLDQMKNLFQ